MPGTALSPFCGRKDCPNIEAVLDRLLLANAPDFINDGIPHHDLFSHEFFRRADDRTFTPMLTADQRKGFRNRRVRNMYAIPSYQEIHSMYGCDGDVRGVGSGLTGDFAGCQNTGR